jgi:hypothetical protein
LPYCLIALLPYCLIALLPYCLIALFNSIPEHLFYVKRHLPANFYTYYAGYVPSEESNRN